MPPRRGPGPLGVGDGEHDHPVGDGDVGRPDLAPAQPPAVAVGLGPGAQHGGVGAGVGLGHAEAHHRLARHEAGQDLLGRPLGDALEDGARSERPVADGELGQPVGAAAQVVDVLPGGVVREVAHAAAAHRRRHGQVEVAGRGRGRPDGPDEVDDLGHVGPVGGVPAPHVVEQVGVRVEAVDHLHPHEGFETVEHGADVVGVGEGDGHGPGVARSAGSRVRGRRRRRCRRGSRARAARSPATPRRWPLAAAPCRSAPRSPAASRRGG